MILARPLLVPTVLTLLVAMSTPRAAAQPCEVLLSEPAIARDLIAFVFDGDIWLASPEGFRVQRLTSAPGDEVNPVFSPDGRSIAFSARYDGNLDVYVVDLADGRPRRLTWHPGDDYVLGFHPLSGDVLFRSARACTTDRHTQLYLVATDGGFPRSLGVPTGYKATFSPDGKFLAYVPLPEAFEQWKGYRGGRASRIWILDLSTFEWREIPQPAGRCNDTDPMWIGPGVGTIVFRSDREGEFTLFRYDVEKGGQPTRLLPATEWPIVDASTGDGRIVFEREGRLYRIAVPDGNTAPVVGPVRARVPAELRERRPRWVGSPKDVRHVAIDPAGRRVALAFRGEIVTLPVADGGARNRTATPGAHERAPAFSPDGARLAYFSDERPDGVGPESPGAYRLHVRTLADDTVTTFALADGVVPSDAEWSPDGKRIAFTDHRATLFAIDVESGTLATIAETSVYGPRDLRRVEFAWSPDSRWIAFVETGETLVRRLKLHGFDRQETVEVSPEVLDASAPAFDASGSYLFFLGSTDAGPRRRWLDQSSGDASSTRSLYCAVLYDDLPSPFKRRRTGDPPKEPTPGDGRTIGVEGLPSRIVRFPVPAGDYDDLRTGAAGDVYFRTDVGAHPALCRYRFSSGVVTTLRTDVDAYHVARDGTHLVFRHGDAWSVCDAGSPETAASLHVDRIRVRIDPPQEWVQIFDEAWRINRDFFYDEKHHGVRWAAQRTRYAQFLPHLATRRDLDRVIRWMCSELGVGHHRVWGGQPFDAVESIGVGLLGADFVVSDGRYRFAKVYRGAAWDPTLRAPLAEPGARVADGEFLIAVRGRDVTASTNVYAAFENTAGSVIEITVAADAAGTDARTIEVVPIADELPLRHRSWVEANRRYVDEATRGRVAYIHLPDTTRQGLAAFTRSFYAQSDRDALILDERYNRGGQVADRLIDVLRRRHIAYWATRNGDLESPGALIAGPKVMIIDETAGSGGDLLPWMFRKFRLGRIVGRPTWGGLVGALAMPVLMDGGHITAPDLAIWTAEDGWVVENVGVEPDRMIELQPADFRRGVDSQLEAAIANVTQMLATKPPTRPKRPAPPVRGGGKR